jgi:hypothetical protein
MFIFPMRTVLIACAMSIACALLGVEPVAAKSGPEWVVRSGSSAELPPTRFLIGFAQATGKDEAIESAKQQAAADLARQISVQIESSVVDVTRESGGRFENDLTSAIRATSDIRLDGIRFETYRKRKNVWALAVLERLPASLARRKQRDHALSLTKQCLDAAAAEEKAGHASQALDAYRSCRKPLNEALEHEAIAAALQRGGLLQDEVGEQLARHATRINTRVRAIPHEDAHSIRTAAEGLAAQLAQAGIGRGRNIQVAPLVYQGRDISSPFGRELAIALESAIGRTPAAAQVAPPGAIVVRGTYREGEGDFQVRVNAKQAGTGSLLASAEIVLAKRGVPSNMETRPANFDRFASDADKLAGGEVVSGDLRVEIRTDKGTRGIVYDEGEELTLFVRVNQPAWIRLIYVLTSGHHIPITQEWYVDESKVNQLVEYPTSFEIVAPFGVEMIHAMASSDKPAKLATQEAVIDGEYYDVLPGGADQVVTTRGIARKKKQEVAEQTLQLTTMRVPLQ